MVGFPSERGSAVPVTPVRTRPTNALRAHPARAGRLTPEEESLPDGDDDDFDDTLPADLWFRTTAHARGDRQAFLTGA